MSGVALDFEGEFGFLDVLDELEHVDLVDSFGSGKIVWVYDTILLLNKVSQQRSLRTSRRLTLNLRAPSIHSVRPSITLPTLPTFTLFTPLSFLPNFLT